MSSKYINIEEAAGRLKMSVDDLNRMREKGDIRAFSDRGTWKFRSEDIDELARNMEPDSGFDIPSSDILKDDQIGSAAGPGSQIIIDDEVGDLPTVISKQSPLEPPSSDSDVRLVVDPSIESDDWDALVEPGSSLMSDDSDSDVQLADESLKDVAPTPLRANAESEGDDIDWSSLNDSDVRLTPVDETDSDVKLEEQPAKMSLEDSDSDVTLQEPEGLDDIDLGLGDPTLMTGHDSDSDVALIGVDDEAHESDFRLSGIHADDIPEGPGSDLTLMPPEDSGIRLEEVPEDSESILSDVMSDPASGLSFSSGDSGLSLDLALDSGISLEDNSTDDDSITLASDSGISLVPDTGSGLTLADDYQGNATIPMMGAMDDDEDDTSFDMPLLDDSGPEVHADDDTTGVVMFDDDESGETMEFDSSELSGQDEFVDFDDDEDSFAELSDGELEVSDDLLDDDILEADDDVFEDEFESGESVPALAVPGAARAGGAAMVAADWDMVSFSLVLLSTVMMGVCTLLMFDLVRSMWGFAEPNGVNGMVLEALQGLIKS